MPKYTIDEKDGGSFFILEKDGKYFERFRDRVDAEMRIAELNAEARLKRLNKLGKDTSGFMDDPFR